MNELEIAIRAVLSARSNANLRIDLLQDLIYSFYELERDRSSPPPDNALHSDTRRSRSVGRGPSRFDDFFASIDQGEIDRVFSAEEANLRVDNFLSSIDLSEIDRVFSSEETNSRVDDFLAFTDLTSEERLAFSQDAVELARLDGQSRFEGFVSDYIATLKESTDSLLSNFDATDLQSSIHDIFDVLEMEILEIFEGIELSGVDILFLRRTFSRPNFTFYENSGFSTFDSVSLFGTQEQMLEQIEEFANISLSMWRDYAENFSSFGNL